MEMDFGLLVAAFLIGLLAGLPFWAGVNMLSGMPKPKDLAQAICEEEYDMDLNYFNKKEIYCKPKIESMESYDGFIINIE